jgi:hypothetical protein
MLRRLLSHEHHRSTHFHERIRAYNSALAFASLGAKIDQMVGRGPYCFRIHGSVYHSVPRGLNPIDNNARKYAQLYVIDNQEATRIRLSNAKNVNLNENLLHQLDLDS